MKHHPASPARTLGRLECLSNLLVTAMLAVVFLLGLLVSCANPAQKERLARLGNVALVAAELGGGINPTQAALVRSGGALLLTTDPANDPDGALQRISEQALAYAVAKGTLTQAEADALTAAGQVPLTPAPTPPVTVLTASPSVTPAPEGSAGTPARALAP